MSQVNKFNQLNNPDYVYFDLQQTNIYNTTTQEQQPLKFLETRETPVIKNTGDYYMSVARFQLDTYNLPVIVGEPDLTQTGTYDPDQTIYKVALIPKKSNMKSPVTTLIPQILIQNTNISDPATYGNRVAFQPNTAYYSVVIGDYNGDNFRGSLVYALSTDNINVTRQIYSAPNIAGITGIGGNSVGISEDSQFLISNGMSSTNQYTLVWSRANSPTAPYVLTFNLGEGGPSQISGDATKIIVGRLVGQSADVLSYKFNRATGAFTQWAQVFSSKFSEAEEPIGLRGIGMSNDGIDVVVTNPYYEGPGSYARGAIIFIKMDYNNAGNPYEIVYTAEGDFYEEFFGSCVCMSANGLVVATYAPNNGNPYIKIYNKTTPGGVTTWTLGQTLIGGQVEELNFLSLNADGTYLYTASNTSKVKRFKKTSGTYAYELTLAQFTNNNNVNVASNSTGINALVVEFGGATGVEQFIGTIQINSGDILNLPPLVENVPVIEPVKWIKDVEDVTAPTKNSLTGKNTALYPYYYCYSYNNFITMVNKTLKLAYKKLMETLYNNWINLLGVAQIKNQFLSISARQYPTPPFIDWNESNLTADVYVSMLFETYQTAVNAVIANINYAMPETVWGAGGGNSVGVAVSNTPFEFELAFNAPLYSLFSSLPATKKVITNSTGKRELYYTLNFNSTGLGLVNPNPNLNSIIPYSFLSTYTNPTTGVVTIPITGSDNFSHQKLLIKQGQEISTIDTWTPVNAIVFTTTSIPIIVNQFTASSSIGSNPPSSSLDNAFAFIITDLQSNQQGYRPNILLTPKIYRMIDLTGNQPLKNIDINVFWRTKTGNLIPFTLASGAMSSIKLLFQKKVLGENQQINMASMTMRDIM